MSSAPKTIHLRSRLIPKTNPSLKQRTIQTRTKNHLEPVILLQPHQNDPQQLLLAASLALIKGLKTPERKKPLPSPDNSPPNSPSDSDYPNGNMASKPPSPSMDSTQEFARFNPNFEIFDSVCSLKLDTNSDWVKWSKLLFKGLKLMDPRLPLIARGEITDPAGDNVTDESLRLSTRVAFGLGPGKITEAHIKAFKEDIVKQSFEFNDLNDQGRVLIRRVLSPDVSARIGEEFATMHDFFRALKHLYGRPSYLY
ncbi:hypothetical protein N7466_005179 [Penicillium verhagenii]|uniref:uncharacterized protein n=1 Tax=Penicillium verhagenii TaxID=1562060 RepID=UPI00254504C9|nr:uncharacterized protein N7466_005179 [Penicillium verhagenii]KAJ5935632.1 hypothetical protein N7466_005179 [Penicillium verhagenii]